MKFSYTSLFRRSYGNLSEVQQKQIDKALTRFGDRYNPPFPKGWRVHKLSGIKGTPTKDKEEPPDVWEMHAPGKGALILTFQRGKEEILCRNCGLHDKTLQSP